MKKQTVKWTTRTGEKVRLCDMTDMHLINTMRMLERAAEIRKTANLHFYLSISPPTADMAMMAFESELDKAIMANMEDFLPDIYWKMKKEKYRRGINHDTENQ